LGNDCTNRRMGSTTATIQRAKALEGKEEQSTYTITEKVKHRCRKRFVGPGKRIVPVAQDLVKKKKNGKSRKGGKQISNPMDDRCPTGDATSPAPIKRKRRRRIFHEEVVATSRLKREKRGRCKCFV